jgi:DNA-binding NtrC family response regulator
MSLSSDDALALCATLFLRDDGGTAARLIQANQDRAGEIVAEWHALCASSFGAHETLSERHFREACVPDLLSAWGFLLRRDAAGLVRLARSIGERQARSGVPFVGYVAYLNSLRQSYAKVFAGDPALGELLRVVDDVHGTLLAVVAEHCFAGPHREALADGARNGGSGVPVATRAERGEEMIGRSPALARVREKVACVAPLDSAVLILGETGTGKELVARAIHRESPRGAKPFVAVNCAALPRELVESELFGHRRGAFSGALNEAQGLFRAAAGGTLLLDELTEMPPELQAKLLRVLQERAVRPVGATAEIPIDVRVLASSNSDPDVAIPSGRLRADLYYRVSASTIALPPLRDRLDDVPLLAEHVLARCGRRGRPPARLSAGAVAMLRARPWPGNVRELVNVIEEAHAMASGPEIDEEALLRTGRFAGPALPAPCAAEVPTRSSSERSLVARALAQSGGNKLRAARQLGISRTTLYAMIAKYGLG